MKNIVDMHDKREAGVANYLDGLMGERPIEGAMNVKSFEHVDSQMLDIKQEVIRQYAESAEALTAIKKKTAVIKKEIAALREQLSQMDENKIEEAVRKTTEFLN